MTKRPLSILCDETTAHCVFCRGPQGAVFADAMAETFDFAREADGRPVCIHGREPGWEPPPPAPPKPLPRRRVKLDIVVPAEVAEFRSAECATCTHNVDGVCEAQKKKCGGAKKAIIAAGVWMPAAHCPADTPKWGKWPAVTAETEHPK